MNAFRLAIRVLLTPGCWFRLYPTSPALTRFILARLAEGEKPARIDGYSVRLGHLTIWAENYPYGFGHLHGYGEMAAGAMPSRRAAFMLRDAMPSGLVEERVNAVISNLTPQSEQPAPREE